MGDQQASRRSLRVGGGTGTRAPGRDPTGRPVTKMAERLPRGPAGGRDGSRGGGGAGKQDIARLYPPSRKGLPGDTGSCLFLEFSVRVFSLRLPASDCSHRKRSRAGGLLHTDLGGVPTHVA